MAAALLRQGPAALSGFTLAVGQGVSPMLAGSAPTVPEALVRTGPAGVEWKLDGIRAQIHKDGPHVTVLTRSLEDITDRVPEVVDAVAAWAVSSAILDGELIALDDDGRPRPFQQTGSRTARRSDPAAARVSVPLTLFVFDVLHLDGRDLLDEPGSVRRSVLEATLPVEVLTPRLAVVDAADPTHVEAAAAFAADALSRGHEGVVVKSDEATYDMGRRGAGWVKVKPVHTLDLVILAVERGNGRRSGWLQQPAPRRAGPRTLRRAGRLRDAGQDVQGADRRDAALADPGAAAARRRADRRLRRAAAPRGRGRDRLRRGADARRATPPGWPCGSPGSCATATDKRPAEADTIEAVQALHAP